MEIKIKKENLVNLPYFLPIVFIAIFLLKIPLSMIPIREVDPYGHLLKAKDIAEYGIKAVFWEYSVYADIGGRPSLYPPMYHIILSVFYKFLGPYWTNFTATALQYFLISFSVWFFVYKKIGKNESILALLFLYLFPINADRWFIPIPQSFLISFLIFFIYFFTEKKKLESTILLSIILYTHYFGIVVSVFFLIYSFLKEKKMVKSVLISIISFIPWMIFFIYYYFTFPTLYAGAENVFYLDVLRDMFSSLTNILILLILSFYSLNKKEHSIIIYSLIVFCFIYFMIIKQALFFGTIYPLLCILASASFSKENKFVNITIISVFLIFLLFPGFVSEKLKNTLFVHGAYGYYDGTTNYKNINEPVSNFIKSVSDKNEIIYTPELINSAIISVLSDRKITAGWGNHLVPKNAMYQYQRVNYFENQENIPKEFKIVYSSPYGYVAINESYLPS